MQPNPTPTERSTETTLIVSGMHCSSCVRRINAALAELSGVMKVHVDVPSGRVEIEHDRAIALDTLIQAIEAAGYGARSIESSDRSGHFVTRSVAF